MGKIIASEFICDGGSFLHEPTPISFYSDSILLLESMTSLCVYCSVCERQTLGYGRMYLMGCFLLMSVSLKNSLQ